jgi:hypothetical protein
MKKKTGVALTLWATVSKLRIKSNGTLTAD